MLLGARLVLLIEPRKTLGEQNTLACCRKGGCFTELQVSVVVTKVTSHSTEA